MDRGFTVFYGFFCYKPLVCKNNYTNIYLHINMSSFAKDRFIDREEDDCSCLDLSDLMSHKTYVLGGGKEENYANMGTHGQLTVEARQMAHLASKPEFSLSSITLWTCVL